MGFVHRLLGCSFLAAGVCLFVDKTGPRGRVYFLDGGVRAQGVLRLVPAPWCVEQVPLSLEVRHWVFSL